MKWDAHFIFIVTLCVGATECRSKLTRFTETKKPCDRSATDAQHQTNNKLDAITPEANGNIETACDDNGHQNYDYVIEDPTLLQNDQPASADRHSRLPYSYGSGRKQPQHFEKNKVHQHHHHHHQREDPNVEYTKEVVIKQGRLKGLVRRMHAQTGLRNVDQYLGK